jgi:hypothetical protein
MNMHQHEQENWTGNGSHLPRLEQIPHYYGDIVRILFLGMTVIMLGGAPLYADALTQQIPFIVAGAVILVALAALTNPRGLLIIRLDAVFAGVIAVVYETWALWGYESGSSIEFVVREIPALMGMFAFYFALKTLRAMLLGNIGKSSEPNEFALPVSRRRLRGPEQVAVDYTEDALGHPAALEDDLGG